LPQFDYYRLASCFGDVGFSNTGINTQPEAFRQAKGAYNKIHAPLVAARAKFEKEQLPGRFDKWLAGQKERLQVAPGGTIDVCGALHCPPIRI
jgi:hypothetical protein